MKKEILLLILCLFSGFAFSQTMEDTTLVTAVPAIADTDTIYSSPEVQAQFQGGNEVLIKFLAKYLRYPKESRDKNINGTVMVKFIVEKDGSLSDPQILNSLDERIDDEVLSLINSMPAWIPATSENLPVRSYYSLPIRFELKKKTKI